MKDLAPFLVQRQQQHLYRSRAVSDSAQGPLIVRDGRQLLNFCSNDYLGLAAHPLVREAMHKGIDQYGVGAGAAHLVNGHSRAHHLLEQELAEFTGRSRALLFSTGYMANLGVATALMQRGDHILADRNNHASILDAALLSGARLIRYDHNNADHAAQRLQGLRAAETLIMTDGVFSMDGDIAPLMELASLAQQQQAWLMVDDAHGFGVLGEQGVGTLDHYGLSPQQVPILMGTLGKALGGAGAFVAGSDELIETLIQTARSYIYTTASPPAVAEAVRAALRLVQAEPERRSQLNKLIRYFRAGAAERKLPLAESITPIQPLRVANSEMALQLTAELLKHDIQITAMRPPTVSEACLRITLSAAHTENQLDRLLDTLAELPGLVRTEADAS
ncbi:MAG TPA: 8-amino-7-oxononanoate synthase [Gammaproteobacteria bacterium]|nr:8-amino-7-oxononanoate synthase [Gammaproteobacteria bacterium]